MDGSHNSINYFDRLKTDDAYAALLEIEPDRLASSHQNAVKYKIVAALILKASLFAAGTR